MSDEGHYDNTPGAREDGAVPAQTVEQYFKGLLTEYQGEITAMLTAGLTWSRFMNSCLAAMRRDPSFLEGTTKRSVVTALIQSAQDGLVPDGKEGVITPYKNKKSGKREAKWNPMTQGLRKRARELDSMLIDAQVVHEKDAYKRIQGDDPKIIHEPADHLPDRGPMTLAYAIFKREDGTILHREVMNRAQIMDVKSQSYQQDSLMWTKFETEAWRKTVIRRGIKTVPVSDALMQVASRDDDAFTFDHEPAEPKAALVPPPAPKLESKPAQTLDASLSTKGVPLDVIQERKAAEILNTFEVSDAAYPEMLKDFRDELQGCETEDAVCELRDRVLEDLKVGDRADWLERCAERSAEIFNENR